MSENARRYHSSNAGRESKPVVWLFEGEGVLWMLGSAALALLAFEFSQEVMRHSVVESLAAGVTILVAAAAFVLRLKAGKPRSYAREFFEWLGIRLSVAVGGIGLGRVAPFFSLAAAAWPGVFAATGLKPGRLPQAYWMDGLIVFGGPWKHGYVSRGFRLECPGWEHAGVTRLNDLEDGLLTLVAGLDGGVRLQFQHSADGDYCEALLRFRKATEKLAAGEDTRWSRRQRDERFTRYWKRMESGRLLRDTLHVYVTTRIEDLPPGASSKGARERYEAVLQGEKLRIEKVAQGLRELVGRHGGVVVPLEDRHHFEELYRFLNPSVGGRENFDWDEAFEAEGNLLETCIHGDAAPLDRPDHGFYLDGHYHGILVLQTLPKATFSGMLTQLSGLGLRDMTITVNVEALDDTAVIEREERELERLKRAHADSGRTRLGEAIRTKEERVRRLMSNEIRAYRGQWIVRVWAPEKARLREMITVVKNAVTRMGGARHYEPAFPPGARNYFCASVPGWSWSPYDDHFLYVEGANLANLLPLPGALRGDLDGAEALYDDSGGRLVGVKTFSGSVGHESPQHAIVSGANGSGKSLLVDDLLTQSGPHYDYTVIVDNGRSHEAYARLADEHSEPVMIEPDGHHTFNYLDTRGLPLNPDHLGSATSLLHLLTAGGATTERDGRIEAQLRRSLDQFYTDAFDQWAVENSEALEGVTRKAVVLTRWRKRASAGAGEGSLTETVLRWREWERSRPDEARALLESVNEGEVLKFQRDPETSDLVRQMTFAEIGASEMPTHGQLQEFIAMEGHGRGRDADELRRLAELLEPWCAHGRYGAILDGPGNVSFNGKVIHIELGMIPESAPELRNVAAFLITNQLRNEVMRRPRGQRKRIVLEELSSFLSIPGGARITREFFETMRKYNTWVCAVIQQWDRLKTSEAGASVLGNIRTAFFLRQSDRREVDRVAEVFSLPESTRETILGFSDPCESAEAGFVYYRLGGQDPRIVTARNELSGEMLYAASTTGEAFDRRRTELADNLPLYEQVIARVHDDGNAGNAAGERSDTQVRKPEDKG